MSEEKFLDGREGKPSVTVEELDALVQDLFKRKQEIKDEQEKVDAKTTELESLKAKIVVYLTELNREQYKTQHGTVSRSEKWNVTLPADDIAKAQLFDHLRSRGIFEKYATVNSKSLNSLYMADWKAAQKEGPEKGMEYRMPGINPPTLFVVLSMTKGKES